MQLRMTNQREMILQELKKSKDHLTADELYERVKKKMPRISLATVYRNLEILSEACLIGKLEVSGRQKRFDWDIRDHDHVHCIQCHRVDNVELDRTHIDVSTPESVSGYRITGYRLEFSGLCTECAKKINKEKEN
jgi:Fur family transcriptional regulator, ferric uptake regulator